MTKQECEKLLTKKAEELIAIYKEYAPDGRGLTVHFNLETRPFINHDGKKEMLTPMLSIYSSYEDLSHPIRVLNDIK